MSQETKHTPGPWKVDRLKRIYDDNDIIVAVASEVLRGHRGETVEANARLIAAAPDMLAALEDVMEWISNWNPNFEDDPEWPETRDSARAALAKAKGDSNG